MSREIVEVSPVGGHRLKLRFDDGVDGTVDLSEFVSFDGIFAPLVDPAAFAQAYVDPNLGTVCWPNGADLDPDVLYARVTGNPPPT